LRATNVSRYIYFILPRSVNYTHFWLATLFVSQNSWTVMPCVFTDIVANLTDCHFYGSQKLTDCHFYGLWVPSYFRAVVL